MYDDDDFSANEMCCECKGLLKSCRKTLKHFKLSKKMIFWLTFFVILEWTYCPGNYEHIKKNWMCDGLVSCRDGSDEICCGKYDE